MSWDSSLTCPRAAVQNMHDEADFIATDLMSRSVTRQRDGAQQLRCDMLNLSDRQLLDLEKEMRTSAPQRGLINPLRRLPEVEKSQAYNRFTGNEMVVLTNPFDELIETVRLTHENSFPKDKNQMLYFDQLHNAMVDNRANDAAYRNEIILSQPRHDDS